METIEQRLNNLSLPLFPGELCKNDALFLQGALDDKELFVFTYVQTGCEVVHGPSCRINDEINVDECAKDNVRIIARRGGGGTVVLSDGMCITIVVGKRYGRFASPIFNSIHEKMIHVLDNCGVKNCKHAGISDIMLNNKKILGSSLYLGSKPALFYYQSSIMVSSDISLISKYLKYPPKEPEYRKQRDHSEFCTTLAQEGYAISADKIAGEFLNL